MIQQENGFTTLELAVVLALMVILMSMFVPSLNYFQNRRGADSARELNKTITDAVIVYYGMTGNSPADGILTSGDHNDISETESQALLQKIFDVTGYKILEQYSHEDFAINIHVLNEYITKIEFVKR